MRLWSEQSCSVGWKKAHAHAGLGPSGKLSQGQVTVKSVGCSWRRIAVQREGMVLVNWRSHPGRLVRRFEVQRQIVADERLNYIVTCLHLYRVFSSLWSNSMIMIWLLAILELIFRLFFFFAFPGAKYNGKWWCAPKEAPAGLIFQGDANLPIKQVQVQQL